MIGSGSYVPDTVVSNERVGQSLGVDPDRIVRQTGIRERRHARPEQATSDLAVQASTRALSSAGVEPSDIDLIVLGTFTPDMAFPSTACLVQDRLGIVAPAIEVEAACAGFMHALVTASAYIVSGAAENALVIGADCNSSSQSRRSFPLFGDGAGA
jgi:3-oxoacyl-[acyl-carrier-protein] synthase-3